MLVFVGWWINCFYGFRELHICNLLYVVDQVEMGAQGVVVGCALVVGWILVVLLVVIGALVLVAVFP